MTTILSMHAFDMGDDRLRVVAVTDQGDAVIGEGWLSAETNYYPPDQYKPDGSLIDGATSRAMTADEVTAYRTNLVTSQLPPAVSTL